MPNIQYNIHDLISITIDEGVNKAIIRDIDFQIRYFKISSNGHPSPRQIRIAPFERFPAANQNSFEMFHLVEGLEGNAFRDPDGQFALQRVQGGFEIYSDQPMFLINLFIQLLLIEQGISLIHAAAVADKDGNVIVLPGPGGVGKTALLGELVGRQNFRVLGDDIVGLSRSGECLAFPRSFALKEYHQSVYPEVFRRLGIGKKSDKKKSLQRFGLRLLWLLRENAPLVGISRSLMRGMGVRARPMQAVPPSPAHLQELGYLAAVPVEDIFGADKILTKGPIAKIIFLERYAGKQFRSETISHTSLAQRMFAIIHHEWVADMRRFFSLGALEILDLNNYFKTVNQIIRDAVADKPCNLMKIPENTTPDDLVKFFLDNFT